MEQPGGYRDFLCNKTCTKCTWEIGCTCTVVSYTYMHLRIQLLRSLSPCILRFCDKNSGVITFVIMNHGYSEKEKHNIYAISISSIWKLHACMWLDFAAESSFWCRVYCIASMSMQLYGIDKVKRFKIWGDCDEGESARGKNWTIPRGSDSINFYLINLLQFQMTLIRCVVQNHPRTVDL